MSELGTCDHCGCYANLCDECVEKFRESSLNDLLCNLIAEWEIEGDSLDNDHDTSYDRGIGQTYKKCASELRKIIDA